MSHERYHCLSGSPPLASAYLCHRLYSFPLHPLSADTFHSLKLFLVCCESSEIFSGIHPSAGGTCGSYDCAFNIRASMDQTFSTVESSVIRERPYLRFKDTFWVPTFWPSMWMYSILSTYSMDFDDTSQGTSRKAPIMLGISLALWGYTSPQNYPIDKSTPPSYHPCEGHVWPLGDLGSLG